MVAAAQIGEAAAVAPAVVVAAQIGEAAAPAPAAVVATQIAEGEHRNTPWLSKCCHVVNKLSREILFCPNTFSRVNKPKY